MPRPRSAHNKHLPKGWAHEHGAYFYSVPRGLESLWDGKRRFRLGTTLPEAYKVWAERVGRNENAKTIGQLLDRYGMEVVPTKAPKTRTENARHVTKLRGAFGKLRLDEMRPQLVYQYVDRRRVKKRNEAGKLVGGVTVAHREVEVLSHAFTKAVEWGYIDRHPFKGEVRLQGEKPRTRYVEDWEIVECLALPSVRKRGSVHAIHAYMRIKLLTGLRRSDLLRLRVVDCKDDGIHVRPHKTENTTGKSVIYEWTDELRAAVDAAKAARPVHISPWLFCNRDGACYVDEEEGEAHGWDSMWQRFMDRVLKETKVTERFTEHDLRAKCASDAETLEHARALLAHADSRTTDRIYRRKAERVRPLR
jgi:integrase